MFKGSSDADGITSNILKWQWCLLDLFWILSLAGILIVPNLPCSHTFSEPGSVVSPTTTGCIFCYFSEFFFLHS